MRTVDATLRGLIKFPRSLRRGQEMDATELIPQQSRILARRTIRSNSHHASRAADHYRSAVRDAV
jgi:hypothetical protein